MIFVRQIFNQSDFHTEFGSNLRAKLKKDCYYFLLLMKQAFSKYIFDLAGGIPSRGTRWPLYYTLLGLEISTIDQWEGQQMAAGGSQPGKADWLAKGIFSSVEKLQIAKYVTLVTVFPQIVSADLEQSIYKPLWHLFCELYALVLMENPYPRLYPWRNQTLFAISTFAILEEITYRFEATAKSVAGFPVASRVVTTTQNSPQSF